MEEKYQKVISEIKKELAEIKEILSKLLVIQQKEFEIKYVEPFKGPQTKSINQNHY